MLYRMVRPVLRKGSRNRQFHQRIPTDVLSRTAGLRLDIPLGDSTVTRTLSADTNTVRISLQTDDPDEVKRRQAGVATYLASVWTALRNDVPVSLTHRQATALAGELFRTWADDNAARSLAIEQAPEGGWRLVQNETDDDREAEWSTVNAYWEAMGETGRSEDLEGPLWPLAARLLLGKGIGRVDGQSRQMLLEAFWKALRDAFEIRKRHSQGDYRPDPNADRYPAWTEPNEGRESNNSTALHGKRTGLTQLVSDWWKEAKAAGRKQSTYESYRNTMGRLVGFLKHDDSSRLTAEDIIRFKDFRLESGVSAKTVKDSDLAGLKTIFGWAVMNRRMAFNPVEGLSIKVGKRRKLRGPGFTDSEASLILKHARDYVPGGEAPKLAAAKRWVPWLCAFTGARVGEMLQLRKQDVRQDGPHWVIRVTPDAGPVKTDEAREVVLHRQVIEAGFLQFHQASGSEYLFISPGKGELDVRNAVKTARNKVNVLVRQVVSDPDVDPSHGWRHRFKTVGMEQGVAMRVLDAIQGHAPRNASEQYGEVTIKAKASAIAMFPFIDV